MGTLKSKSFRKPFTYCSSTFRRSYFTSLVSEGLARLSSGFSSVVRKSYLKPVGDLNMDLIYPLDSVLKSLNGLAWLEIGLERREEKSWSAKLPTSVLAELKVPLKAHGLGGTEGEMLTSMPGYSDRDRSSIVAAGRRRRERIDFRS